MLNLFELTVSAMSETNNVGRWILATILDTIACPFVEGRAEMSLGRRLLSILVLSVVLVVAVATDLLVPRVVLCSAWGMG